MCTDPFNLQSLTSILVKIYVMDQKYFWKMRKICTLCTRAELFKAGLRYPRVSSKFEFRYERL